MKGHGNYPVKLYLKESEKFENQNFVHGLVSMCPSMF